MDIKYNAAGVQRYYALKLDLLKAKDNVEADQDQRAGVISQDGFRAAYLEKDDSFAFVSQQGSRLEYAVFTPKGSIQAGTIDPQGESFLESNLYSSGISSGRMTDYDEVIGSKVEDDRDKAFAERKQAQFSAALEEAFLIGHLPESVLR
ncbi:MAG: hypothetical protein KF760_28735 [Candidatus Eremiobacteraeota bacterium]|nr:hypothetical protein [Candidatus Eremiobacteraeota bacterium]MCW5865883.1 hypothetical protein [Candidatus Eremiobacteraeota bacterium]